MTRYLDVNHIPFYTGGMYHLAKKMVDHITTIHPPISHRSPNDEQLC